MVTLPTPNNPTTSYTATYDAWNRLVKLEDDTNTITEYQYDGTRRRTLHKVYNTGVLDHTKHLYYNANWQLLEERRDANTSPKKQYTWGNRYIDDLILRDHDTNNDGTLNERLYALQDANWNVTAYINESGTVLERYIYNAYGHVTFLDNNFNVITSSTIEPDHLYAGYNFDCDVKMYHVRNRVYHPMLGCWLQRDPIEYHAGDVNLLRYVTNTPTSFLDSSGEFKDCCCPGGKWKGDGTITFSASFLFGGWAAIVSFKCSSNNNKVGILLDMWTIGIQGGVGFKIGFYSLSVHAPCVSDFEGSATAYAGSVAVWGPFNGGTWTAEVDGGALILGMGVGLSVQADRIQSLKQVLKLPASVAVGLGTSSIRSSSCPDGVCDNNQKCTKPTKAHCGKDSKGGGGLARTPSRGPYPDLPIHGLLGGGAGRYLNNPYHWQ